MEPICYLSQIRQLLFQSRYGSSENKSSWFVVSDLIIKQRVEEKKGNTFRHRTTEQEYKSCDLSTVCKHGYVSFLMQKRPQDSSPVLTGFSVIDGLLVNRE